MPYFHRVSLKVLPWAMGRITEYIAYLNSKDEKIDKSFSYLTVTDKIAQKRFELLKKNRDKSANV
jgi:hypothetical protein